MRFQKLQAALVSGLFNPELCKLVTPPSEEQVIALSAERPWPLSSSHIELLTMLGGSNLDEIRIASLEDIRSKSSEQAVLFATDPSGFVFWYAEDGAVFQEDTDGGSVQIAAASLESFFADVLLGNQCVSLYGEGWLIELRRHGLVD